MEMHVQAHVHTKQPEPSSRTGLCLSPWGCLCPGGRLFYKIAVCLHADFCNKDYFLTSQDCEYVCFMVASRTERDSEIER